MLFLKKSFIAIFIFFSIAVFSQDYASDSDEYYEEDYSEEYVNADEYQDDEYQDDEYQDEEYQDEEYQDEEYQDEEYQDEEYQDEDSVETNNYASNQEHATYSLENIKSNEEHWRDLFQDEEKFDPEKMGETCMQQQLSENCNDYVFEAMVAYKYTKTGQVNLTENDINSFKIVSKRLSPDCKQNCISKQENQKKGKRVNGLKGM